MAGSLVALTYILLQQLCCQHLILVYGFQYPNLIGWLPDWLAAWLAVPWSADNWPYNDMLMLSLRWWD
jgi:hypothetical protein